MNQNDFTDKASGRLVHSPHGFLAFVPHALPPTLEFDVGLALALSKADAALSELSGLGSQLPNPHLLIAPYSRREAVLSSRIEGTKASLSDLLIDEIEDIRAKPENRDDILEVRNYVRALEYGMRRMADLPLSLRLIREIHAELMTGVRGDRATPGEFRRSQNWIGPAGSTPATAAFVPPPVDEMTACLGEWETFLHVRDVLPDLIQCALMHVQFETIHPFLDGNGRVGRLLIAVLLTERGLLQKPVLYLSRYFKQHRQAYYEHLQAVRTRGAWEPWLAFFLRGVIEVAAEAAETARRILQLREQHRTAITTHLGRAAGNGHKVLESLFDRPIVAVNDVQKMTGTTYAAANSLVSRLVKLGVLSEMTGYARNRRFRYAPYIALFNDAGPVGGVVEVSE